MLIEPAGEIRGVPLWLLREYLVEAGGTVQSPDVIVGEGWQAHLTQLDDYQIGSLRVGQVWLEWQGEGPALAKAKELMAYKLHTRGGG